MKKIIKKKLSDTPLVHQLIPIVQRHRNSAITLQGIYIQDYMEPVDAFKSLECNYKLRFKFGEHETTI